MEKESPKLAEPIDMSKVIAGLESGSENKPKLERDEAISNPVDSTKSEKQKPTALTHSASTAAIPSRPYVTMLKFQNNGRFD